MDGPLSLSELDRLICLFRRHNASLQKLRDEDPLARRIGWPHIPESISVSLAYHLIVQKRVWPELPDAIVVCKGLSGEDIRWERGAQEQERNEEEGWILYGPPAETRRIEVKATGTNK